METIDLSIFIEMRDVGATLLLSSCLTRRVAAKQRWQDALVPAVARYIDTRLSASNTYLKTNKEGKRWSFSF
jgi:hypothetical protein